MGEPARQGWEPSIEDVQNALAGKPCSLPDRVSALLRWVRIHREGAESLACLAGPMEFAAQGEVAGALRCILARGEQESAVDAIRVLVLAAAQVPGDDMRDLAYLLMDATCLGIDTRGVYVLRGVCGCLGLRPTADQALRAWSALAGMPGGTAAGHMYHLFRLGWLPAVGDRPQIAHMLEQHHSLQAYCRRSPMERAEVTRITLCMHPAPASTSPRMGL